jgi:opacity protein-like surface antigen
MKRHVLALALLLALAPLAASAQPGPRYRFELTPTVAYNFGGTLQGSSDSIFDSDLEVQDSGAYGINLDIPLGSAIQLELLANRQASELRFDRGLFGGTQGIADIDVTYYHVGILWQFGDHRVSPYVVASLGVANLNPDIPGASSENRFSGSLGGGVKVFFSDNVGLRFEGRGFFTDLGDNGNNGYGYRCDYYYDSCYGNDFTQGQASVGLILAW